MRKINNRNEPVIGQPDAIIKHREAKEVMAAAKNWLGKKKERYEPSVWRKRAI